jgi:predicted outer membrane protein
MSHLSSSLCLVGAFAVAAGLGGCVDRTQPTQDRTGTQTSPEAPPPPQAENAPGGLPGPTEPQATAPAATASPRTDATKLDDAQITAVLVAIDNGEIDEANLALKRASSPEVKAFADRIARMHKATLIRTSKDATKSKVAPADNPVADAFQADVQKRLATLSIAAQSNFEDVYLDGQLAAHRNALSLIDQMMPAVQDKTLREDLAHERDVVKGHLDDALKVVDDVHLGSTNMQAPMRPHR